MTRVSTVDGRKLTTVMLYCSSVTTTLWPRYNTDLTFDSTIGPSSVDTNLEAGFDSSRKIIIFETVTYNLAPKAGKKTLTAKAKFDLPYKVVEWTRQ